MTVLTIHDRQEERHARRRSAKLWHVHVSGVGVQDRFLQIQNRQVEVDPARRRSKGGELRPRGSPDTKRRHLTFEKRCAVRSSRLHRDQTRPCAIRASRFPGDRDPGNTIGLAAHPDPRIHQWAATQCAVGRRDGAARQRHDFSPVTLAHRPVAAVREYGDAAPLHPDVEGSESAVRLRRLIRECVVRLGVVEEPRHAVEELIGADRAPASRRGQP